MAITKHINLTRIYCWILPILPIMGMYGLPGIAILTFSDYLLMMCYIIYIIYAFKHNQLTCNTLFVPLVIYLLIHPLFLLMYVHGNIDWLDAIGTSWRLAFYVFPLVILSPNFIDKKKLISSFRFIGVTSAIYACIQFIFGTFFRISLSPYLPLLPVVREGIEEQQLGWIDYGWMVRARAWFSEPSTLAIFLILAIFIELYLANNDKNKKYFVSIYILGVFISHSSTGTITLAFLLLNYIYLYIKNKKYKLSISKILTMSLLVPLFLIILYNTGYIERFVNHAFAGGDGLSKQSHFIDIYLIFKNEFSFFEFLLGHGMQAVVGAYLPGWVRTFYSLGIVGILLYILPFIIIAKKNILTLALVLLFCILNIGTEIMLGVYFLLYMSIIFILNDNEANNGDKDEI